MNRSTSIVLILALLILAILIVYFCFIRHKNTDPLNERLSYAKETDDYNYPYVLENLIDKKLCQKIIDNSMDKLVESEVISGKHKNVRNSLQHWIKKDDPIVKNLFDKISSMFNISVDNAEDLQVVRYLPNQFFKEHHDACCDDNEKCTQFIKKGGQRMLTVLIYLNNEFDDGQTYFPKLDLKIKPQTGSAIVFYPLAANSSKCHPYSLHAGLPVSSGEKWIANMWFREDRYV